MLKRSIKRVQAEIGTEFGVAVGVSGGADSLALMCVVGKALGKSHDVQSITLDHGLQNGSLEVAQSAQEKCSALGAQTAHLRSLNLKNGSNLEERARDARYAVFRAYIEEYFEAHGVPLIVLLAHTLDDQAETVLLGLGRGSGTSAIKGMQEFNGQFLRPFLALRRVDTEEICRANALDYWDDPTNSIDGDNADEAPMRTRVRKILMPAYRTLFPNIQKNLARSATLARADSEYLDVIAHDSYNECTAVEGPDSRDVLNIKALRNFPDALRWRIVRLWIRKCLGETGAGSAQIPFERVLEIDNQLIGLGGVGGTKIEIFNNYYALRIKDLLHFRAEFM
jgi:tRNA(Ile)-lysidine synthase